MAAPVRRNSESGFMLLFVFLVAAIAALSLYVELPRVAFESQRMKEDLLVSRGMEYQRAIQLYVRKFQKYPARLEDLESANGMRFLRRRYVDPMTGKDEWRFIRVGPMGEFLDSVTMKKDDKKKSENTFISEFAGVGQTATGTSGVTVANRQRQSDMAGAPGSVNPSEQGPGGGEPGQPVDPNQPQQPFPGPGSQQGQGTGPDPSANPQQPGQAPGQYPQQPPYPQQQPGQYPQQQPFPPVGFPPAGPQQPGQQPQPGQIGFNPVGRFIPGVGTSDRTSNPYGTPASSQTGGQVPQPIPQQQGGFPTQNPDFAKNIMQMITNPNRNTAGAFNQQGQPGQQGMPGVPGMPGAGLALGPGIAGVASKFEAEGIKVINERTKYNEWEFIYDVKKEMEKQGMQTGMPQQNQNPLGPNNPSGTGSRGGFGGSSSSSGFGTGSSSGSGFGNSGGFGNQTNPTTGGGTFGRTK